jgi:hypothetical protein
VAKKQQKQKKKAAAVAEYATLYRHERIEAQKESASVSFSFRLVKLHG